MLIAVIKALIKLEFIPWRNVQKFSMYSKSLAIQRSTQLEYTAGAALKNSLDNWIGKREALLWIPNYHLLAASTTTRLQVFGKASWRA